MASFMESQITVFLALIFFDVCIISFIVGRNVNEQKTFLLFLSRLVLYVLNSFSKNVFKSHLATTNELNLFIEVMTATNYLEDFSTRYKVSFKIFTFAKCITAVFLKLRFSLAKTEHAYFYHQNFFHSMIFSHCQ